MFNRNKKSIGLNLHTPEGVEIARKLAGSADVVAENFRPGTMKKYGLDYATLSTTNQGLIYASRKGFLPVIGRAHGRTSDINPHLGCLLLLVKKKLLVRLVVLLPFKLLRLSLTTP